MANAKLIIGAKVAVLVGFLALVVSTYYLRSEVLALSHIRFSADELRAANELKELRESQPDRVKQHEAAEKHFQLQLEHYRKMLDLYQSDYDEYVKRLEDKFEPPPLPSPPSKPDTPELAQRLYEINVDFRTRKNQYFETVSRLNWVACVAALMLAGGLLHLLLFDVGAPRWPYLAALVLSFVFLIGPALHSFVTGVIGFLEEPRIY